jgi:cap2 methyltransferase
MIKLKMRSFETRDETLNENDGELEYRRRRDDEKTCVSYGQRKLLLSLVSFLSKYTKNLESPIILYIGASPGNNIGICTHLFPNFEWHLYDPARFAITTDVKRNVFVYQKYFDDETAKYWAERRKGRNLIFISDIRTADYTKAKDLNENEDNIELDMRMQRNWVEMIKPDITQLKFRLSYVLDEREKEYEYFDGVIYLQAFCPQTSTETRLVFSDIKYKKYNCEKYEKQLFFHNAMTREKTKFLNEEADGMELVNDWDCSCEVSIWKDYLIWKGEDITKDAILRLSQEATKLLNANKKQSDTLSYLRSNPRIIKNRNFNRNKK